jgi:hypothetical protein
VELRLPTDIDVPELFSQRRAAWLTGLNRATIAKLVSDGTLPAQTTFCQVAREDVERVIGRKLTREDWDKCTVAANRAAMARRED